MDDTPIEIAQRHRQLVAEIGGIQRILRVSAMFRAFRSMMSIEYNDPFEMLRHIHGSAISEFDYRAIAEMLSEAAGTSSSAA